MLMRESLVDKDLVASTEGKTPVVRMLPQACVVKVGGRSVIDRGKSVVYPLVEALARALVQQKLIIGTGGGARTRHVFSIGLDLGLPTGVLAALSAADALGNAHILGTLLAPHGVVAIPPEIFGHLLPFFLRAAPGVIFNGVPPYALWEHPPTLGRIPPHRTDAGSYLTAECFGCKTFTLIKDVDGLYDADPRKYSRATFIPEISVSDLKKRSLETLPFDPVLLDLLQKAKLVKRFQIINGARPELLEPALKGGHVGTVIYAD
jgi:molybdenum storage protein